MAEPAAKKSMAATSRGRRPKMLDRAAKSGRKAVDAKASVESVKQCKTFKCMSMYMSRPTRQIVQYEDR